MPPHQRRRQSKNLDIWSKYFRGIMNKSSIHGLKHLVHKDSHSIEQLLWLVWILLSLAGAITISLSTWRRYSENPTVISMEKNYLEWNTTFPAAAICPTKKYDPDLLSNKVKQLFPGNEEKGEEFLKALAEITIENMDLPDFGTLDPQNYLKTILDIKLNFSYSVSNSNSKSASLQLAITEMGICYYYNSIASLYNHPTYWMTNNWTIVNNVQVFVGNPLSGDIFAQVMEMNSPYRVWLASPNEVVDAAGWSRGSPENHYTSAELTALTIYPSPALASLSLAQRRCRFPSESPLSISPHYSYSLCRSQCRVDLALSLCACVPHFYRSVKGIDIL